MFTTAPPKQENPAKSKYNFFNVGKNSELAKKQQSFKEVQYFGERPREKRVNPMEQKLKANMMTKGESCHTIGGKVK